MWRPGKLLMHTLKQCISRTSMGISSILPNIKALVGLDKGMPKFKVFQGFSRFVRTLRTAQFLAWVFHFVKRLLPNGLTGMLKLL